MKALQVLLPPVWLLLCLILMLLLDYRFPLYEFGLPLSLPIGISVLLCGLGLILISARLFSRAKTPIIPFEKSTRLLTGGVYRYTRNPIYLGMVIILIGAAIALGSLSSLLIVPIFWLIIRHAYILHEESFLLQIFGDEYTEYRRRVRRWL